MSFFSELKRRNVLRIAAAYVAISWLLIQVVETLFPVFGLSDAAIRIIVIVLAIGFIPATVIAWAFELTPDGLKRDSEASRAQSATGAEHKKLDRFIAVALALAVAYFAVDKFVFDPARDQQREQEIADAARAEGEAAAMDRRSDGPPMVAVLPFVTTGRGEDSEFFAAGIHEDLLTQLAQLPSIRVISRTSVMEYKDVERNLREIGEALGADAILEGRVQSSGDQIRINAQLIDAASDEHLWAETFDGELTPASIFELQTNIAEAITSAMHVTLSASSAHRTPQLPTSNMAAYRLYHEANALIDRDYNEIYGETYRGMLEQANELDPSYTRPLAALVGSLALDSFSVQDPETIARAETTLSRIESVAPGSADHLIAQAYYTYYILRNYELARATANQALELAPSDVRLVEMRAWIERRLNDYDAVVETLRLARALSPRNPRYHGTLINNLTIAHRYDEAEAEIAALDGDYYFPRLLGALLDFRHHRNGDKLEAELISAVEEFGEQGRASDLWFAHMANRNYEAAANVVETTPADMYSPGRRKFGISTQYVDRVWTYRLSGDTAKLDEALRVARQDFEDHFNSDEDHHKGEETLGKAFLAAVSGDQEETLRLVRFWRREAATDVPVFVNTWGPSCKLLGVIGLVEETVDCLRQGFSKPSQMAWFLDPFDAYYDEIRDEPAFAEFVAGLEDEFGSH